MTRCQLNFGLRGAIIKKEILFNPMDDTRKIKILYVITKSNWGGAQRYVYDLATNLPKENFEPVVALGGNGVLKTKLEAANIRTINISGLDRDVGFLKEFRAFKNILKIIWHEKPNVIHLNSSKAGALGSLAARLYNIAVSCQLLGFRIKSLIFNSKLTARSYELKAKVVFTAHGWAFREKRKIFARKMIEYVSWFTIILSHKTIIVSHDDARKIENFLWINNKVKVILNGIGPIKFLSKTEARKILLEGRADDLAEQLWIGSIGEIHKNKGLEYAIYAIAKVKAEQKSTPNQHNHNFGYYIIGEGEEREKLQTIIDKEKLQDVVFLCGQKENAPEIITAFDIFLLPSEKEGLPYALLEAGYAGLATIATNVGGIAEVIHDMDSGIVIKAKIVKEIYDALNFLLKHDQKRKGFGERLKETVKTKFTLERMIRETIAVYENC